MSSGSPSSDSLTKKKEESRTISSLLFEGQLLHVGLLLMSTSLTIYNIHNNNNSSQVYEDENSSSESSHSSQEEYQWIVPTTTTTTTTSICYWILCVRVLHHILITVIWRTELYCSDHKLSKFVQSKQVALQITECIDVSYFAMAGNGMLMLAYNDYESSQQLPSSNGNEYYYYIRIFVGLICVLVGSWAIGSAIVYLGPKQLAGYDHFYLPSSSSSSLSSSSKSKENNKCKLIQSGGAYTYVDHPIYYLGMFVDWGIAILAASRICLWMSFSAHISALAFLWGTELPDLKYIYYGEDEHTNNNGNNGNVDKVD